MSGTEQRFTFDAVAAQYDAARPSYPEALFDDCTAELAKGERILEVGCGTGKATEAFARRGFPLVALEPGGQMITMANKAVAGRGNVRFVETTFETWAPDAEPFGLVAAAQAWHWVDPSVAFAKAARVLRPKGKLAVFGNVPVGWPAALQAEFQRIYARHLPDFRNPVPEAAYLPNGPFAAMFDGSGYFGPVAHKAYPWRWKHAAESYVNFLGTRSEHRIMEPAKRDAILAEVAAAISAQGGALEMDWEAHLYIARKKDT